MTDSNTPPNTRDNEGPSESAGPFRLDSFVKATLAALVAAVAYSTVILPIRGISYLPDSTEIVDLPSVKAATLVMCAAVMLSLTMIPAGDRPFEKFLDLVVRLGSLGFAFLSGWFWLESALKDFGLIDYALLIGPLALISLVGASFWATSFLGGDLARYVVRRIRKR